MHIRKSIALVVIDSMPYDSRSFLRSQKNQIFIKIFKNPELNTKRTHEGSLEDELFVHWVSVYCKWFIIKRTLKSDESLND